MPTDIVERLRQIAEQYKCPWGDPGSATTLDEAQVYAAVALNNRPAADVGEV